METLFTDKHFQAGLRVGLAVLFLVGAIVLVQKAWLVFEPLIVAVVFAAALWPWVSRISARPLGPWRWRLPRLAAATLIYTGTFVTGGLLLWLTLTAALPELDRIVAAFPKETQPVRAYLEPFRSGDIAGGAAKVAEDVAKGAAAAADESARSAAGGEQAANGLPIPVNVGALAIGLFGGMATLVLVLIFTFFLLLDGDRFAQWILLLLPKERRPRARYVGQTIRDRISRWVMAIVVYAAVNGLVVTAVTFALGLPSPWLYGVMTIFFSIAPGLGPVTSLIPAFVISLGLSSWQPIAIGVFAVILHAFDSAIFVPRIFGQAMRLPAFLVLIAVLLGAALMGAWGAMISSPVAVAIEVMVREGLGRGVETAEEA